MPKAHTDGMARTCSAATIVSGQSSVTIGGKLWAVDRDSSDHNAGNLLPSATDIWIEGKLIIDENDTTYNEDGYLHLVGSNDAAEGFDDVTVY
jgi:hypothetical protein